MKSFYFIIAIVSISCQYAYTQIPGGGSSCQTAMCLHEQLGSSFNNGGVPATPPTSSCGASDNNMFFYFTPENGNVFIVLESSNCRGMGFGGMEMTVFQTDNCSAFDEVGCISAMGLTDTILLNLNLDPCVNYVLMVDGYMTDECDFRIQATGLETFDDAPDAPTFDPPLPATMCSNEVLELEIDNQDLCYRYTFRSINNSPARMSYARNDNRLRLEGREEGIAEFCFELENPCGGTYTYCYEIEVLTGPEINFIADINTCDNELDFCNYIDFFEPDLMPDPLAQGWEISFHENRRDAENGDSPLSCPYDMSEKARQDIFIRLTNDDLCPFITSFGITNNKPRFQPIELDDYCGPGPIDLSAIIEIEDDYGSAYSGISFHLDEADAEMGIGAISPPNIAESGQYFVRIESASTPVCVTVSSFLVNIVPNPMISVDQPAAVCANDTFSLDLRTLTIDELTGSYNAQDLDIRFFDFLPGEFDLDVPLNPPIVTTPGTYYATAVVPINSTLSDYCYAQPVAIVVDTAESPKLEYNYIAPNCPGDPLTVDFTIPFGNYQLEYTLSNGSIGSFLLEDGFTSEQLFVEPFEDTVWFRIEEFRLIANGSCPAIIPDSFPLVPQSFPVLSLESDSLFCFGDTVQVFFLYDGSDPLIVTYELNGVPTNIDEIEDGDFIEIRMDQNYTVELIYANNGNCDVDVRGFNELRVLDTLISDITDITCIGDTAYQVSISLEGGVGSYFVSGEELLDSEFTSEFIARGENYSFTITDESACNEVIYTGSFNCGCSNYSGTMADRIIHACVTETIMGTHDGEEVLANNDAFYFIMIADPADPLGSIIDSAVSPQFRFDPSTMSTGNTYYIAAISGNEDGGSIDRRDNCLDVSNYQPIIFHDQTEIRLSGDTTVCSGSLVYLQISIEGDLPVGLDLNKNGLPFDQFTIYTSDTLVEVTVTEDSEWRISDIQSPYNCDTVIQAGANTSLSEAADYTYSVACDSLNQAYQVSIIILSPGGPYFINGEEALNNSFTIEDVPSGVDTSFFIMDRFGCAGPRIPVSSRDCDCETDVNSWAIQGLALCDGDSYDIENDITFDLDSNDTYELIIHSDISDPLGSALFQGSTTIINYNASLFDTDVEYYVSLAVGNNQSGSPDLDDPCFDISQSLPIIWYSNPELNILHLDTLCLGEDLILSLDWNDIVHDPITIEFLTLSGWETITLERGQDWVLNGENFVTGLNDLLIRSVTNEYGCSLTNIPNLSFLVLNPIEYRNLVVTCSEDKQTYSYYIDVMYQGSYYTINGEQSESARYFSDTIPASNSNLTITIVDRYKCDTLVIEEEVNCNCSTQGSFPSDPEFLCENQDYALNPEEWEDYNLLPGDELEYILHDGDQDALGSIIARSSTPEFSFDSISMNLGEVYFISRLVGAANGIGGVDETDPCALNSMVGHPIQWVADPEIILNVDPVLGWDCNQDQITLSASDINGNTLNYQWSLSNGATSSSDLSLNEILATGPGTYIVVGQTDPGGCSVSDTIRISASTDAPNISLEVMGTLDCELSSVDISTTGSSRGDSIFIQWILPDGSVINDDSNPFVVEEPGQYTYRLTNENNNCVSTQSVEISSDESRPTVDAGGGGLVSCDSTTFATDARIVFPSGSGQSRWEYGGSILAQNDLNITLNAPGTYMLIAIDGENGCSSSDSLVITADAGAIVGLDVELTDVRCIGEQNGSIVINQVEGGMSPYKYSVNGAPYSSAFRYNELAAGWYEIQVVDAFGCEFIKKVEIKDGVLADIRLGPDTILTLGDSILLAPIISGPDPSDLSWLDTVIINDLILSCDSCSAPVVWVRPTESTEYSAVLITDNGCLVQDSRLIEVKLPELFFVPNAMSPNRDGRNEWFSAFTPFSQLIENIDYVLLYDRWGEQVFSVKNLEPNSELRLWDGRHRGELLNPQVLVWVIQVQLKSGERIRYTGDVTLLH